ncbi:MAG: transposase [Defluviitaleaceae bacterium]|nr:transposase [Defluviitaleaceae bacterium]
MRNKTSERDAPHVRLSKYGLIAQKYLEQIESHYQNVFVDKYVVMPNHIHVLIRVSENDIAPINNGAPRSSRPTSMLPRVLTAFKKLTNKEFGFNIWQDSYNDHIIRDENDYLIHLQYIENNPTKWAYDRYYVE